MGLSLMLHYLADAELEGKQGPKHIRYYFQSYYLTILTSTF